MKKTMGKVLLGTTLALTMILPANASFAAVDSVTHGKELSQKIVVQPEKIKSLQGKEKEDVIKFAKDKAENVQKKIEQKVGIADSIDEKNKALKEIWPTLSEDEKLAYQIGSIRVGTERAPKDLVKALANSSNAFTDYVTGTNVWGNWLFRYWVSNSWTYDYAKIRSANPSETAKVYWAGWYYKGSSVLYSEYQYNQYDYIRNVEGRFESTLIQNWDNGAARFDTKIRANGDYSTNGWIVE
ncbi:hypothetical protein ACS2CL_20280 [Bacillus cereus group sp. BceL296]|uniref:hypothetical protein n=1 Tax=Bacillus cereus group TaxID=86661 RepID=UPI0022DFCD1F|nr:MULTISPECIES: hypothetical protein [unclassified Bacillus cereus group]MDA1624159.1 hypothetical protein [Bacillus cereus group sp. TH206-1LC]MDA1751276.1 hypothetical protein [Bacillus cereus group sp. LD113LC]MDA1823437.1 hypothetical protein [Bacillus cereus group sp. BY2-1LC]HDR6264793.1 hypothetical protein [Bacillus cereus]